jgi:chemotaxis protein methyltransferase CheR
MTANREIDFSQEDARLFQQFILEYSGIDLNNHKRDSLKTTVCDRIYARGFENYQQYHQFLKYHPDAKIELRELLGLVTINETHFFRNQPHFVALREHILPNLVKRKEKTDRTLKIWSAGCSTGEEPYSIGMTLLNALPFPQTWNIEILATDIDYQVLARAKAGIYNKRSLRTIDSARRAEYFDSIGGMFYLHKRLKKMVEFRPFNLAREPYPLAKGGSWDIIFCRNVMIYFKKEQTKRIIHNFSHCLGEDGYLFLGHSESLFGVSDEFSLIEIGNTYAYQKTAVEKANRQESEEPRVFSPRRARLLRKPNRAEPGKRPAQIRQERLAENAPLPDDAQTYLAAGRTAADNGEYEEAAAQYQKALEREPLSAEAHFSMGVISEQLNNLDRAVDEYRKSIYLDDTCALAHFNLARIYHLIGRNEDASREYNNAIRKFKVLSDREEVKFSGGFSAGLLVRICQGKIQELA